MPRDPAIQEILLRVDLVDLIGSYLKLTRTGRSFKGLCPFHAEKTPSFHVYPADGVKAGFYHCFGCKKGGDALTFLIDRDGLEFREALEQLARKVGVELPTLVRQATRQKNRFDVLGQCQAHFRANLRNPHKGQTGVEYLSRRQVPEEMIERFGLGFALDSWDGLVQSLGEDSETLRIAIEQGMIRKRDGARGYYDFFRNRLMFPIHNASGQIIAFAGRDLSGTVDAKYLNTPETDLFHKGRVLYGLHQAKEAIRTRKRAIVVEGHFDVIRMHEKGFEETVAPMGTALTREHFDSIGRWAEEVILLFDGDTAGRTAALRSVAQSWDLQLTVRVAHLPQGSDPDDFLLANPTEMMTELTQNAVPAFTYLVDSSISALGTGTAERSHAVMERVFQSMALMESQSLLDYRLKDLSDRLGVSLDSIRMDWDRFNRKRSKTAGPVTATRPSSGPGEIVPLPTRPNQEWEARKGLRVLLLQDEEKLDSLLGGSFATNGTVRAHLEETLEFLKGADDDELSIIIRTFLGDGFEGVHGFWTQRENDADRWEIEAALREASLPEDPLKTLEDYTNTLKQSYIHQELNRCTQAMRTAEKSQEWDEVSRIAARVDQLVKQRQSILSRSREVK